MPYSDNISVISVQEISCDDERDGSTRRDIKSATKDLLKALFISIFGIIGSCVLVAIPWTTIPRTDSIIY